MQVTLIRDVWCVVLRHCHLFECYVLRSVCRLLRALLHTTLFRTHCTDLWLYQHATRRDSVLLLEWLQTQRAAPSRDLHRLACAAVQCDACRALVWLLQRTVYNSAHAHALLYLATRCGHIVALREIDAWMSGICMPPLNS